MTEIWGLAHCGGLDGSIGRRQWRSTDWPGAARLSTRRWQGCSSFWLGSRQAGRCRCSALRRLQIRRGKSPNGGGSDAMLLPFFGVWSSKLRRTNGFKS
ncbi:hypothetical protein TIFTF001_031775 [Ficus carica]|uniref:Uncharacterized protein n=1 Tax=Ficus carica TaxID=3494 RepID=A0AA88DVA6_FICCA|nr:hypothetical protein TIFTF001_031775 [Ficus carica]